MNIGSLASLFPALSGAQAGTADPSKDGGAVSSNPIAFLQALLQQFQGLQAGGEGTAGQSAAKPEPGRSEGGLDALLEQLRVLAGQTSPSAMDQAGGDGKAVGAAGNLLPSGQSTATSPDGSAGVPWADGQVPAPEQLAQWLAQWLPNQAQGAIQSPAAPETPAAGSGSAALANPVLLATAGDPLATQQSPQSEPAPSEEGEAVSAGVLTEARIKSAFSQLIASATQGGGQASGSEGSGAAMAAVKPGGSAPASGPATANPLSGSGAEASSEAPESLTSSVLKPSTPGLDGGVQTERIPGQSLAPDVPISQPVPAFQPQAPVVSAQPVATPAVQTPVGQPAWSEDLGQHVVWMSGQGVQAAEIRLNPPHLGPLEVRINMSQDQQATVQFASHHAAVREAIESAIPKLREMLGAQNLNLAEVNVSSQSFSERDGRGPAFAFGDHQGSGGGQAYEQASRSGRPSYLEGEGVPAAPRSVGQGLLSLYA